MPQHTGQQNFKATALRTAFDALKSYDRGSGRGALLPIDEAVVASLENKAARTELERQLASALQNGGSAAAREYICSKLALIGSEFCVPPLGALLTSPEAATAARHALEAIPGRRAARTLRDNLSKVDGLQKVGVINSLGTRRDADSVRALTALLKFLSCIALTIPTRLIRSANAFGAISFISGTSGPWMLSPCSRSAPRACRRPWRSSPDSRRSSSPPRRRASATIRLCRPGGRSAASPRSLE